MERRSGGGDLVNRTPLAQMSAKRRDRLAAEGTYQPGSTFARPGPERARSDAGKPRPAGWSPVRSGLRAFPRKVAALLDKRDGICQRCGIAGPLHRHHRRGKGSGGDRRLHAQCACNGLELCTWNPQDGLGGCHRWVHLHPRQAMAEGFIVSHEAERPGDIGVMRFAARDGGATQWPACAGEWLETAPEAGEAA